MSLNKLTEKIRLAHQQERWVEVIELISQTNWQEEPLEPFEARALVEALSKSGDKEEAAISLARMFLDFYGQGEEHLYFERVIANHLIQEGRQAKYQNKLNLALEKYESALRYLNDTPSEKQVLELGIDELKQAIKEDKEHRAKKELEQQRIDAELRKEEQRLKAEQNKINSALEKEQQRIDAELKKEQLRIDAELRKEEQRLRIQREKEENAREIYLSKNIKELSGLSPAIVEKLNGAGILTLGDLSESGDKKIDNIPGIGEVALQQIRAFKNEHKL